MEPVDEYDPRIVKPITEEELQALNPPTFDITNSPARFFVLKPFSEDDVHLAVKYGVWTSSQAVNQLLTEVFYECVGQYAILLFFSVRGSKQFLGVAQMMSPYVPEATFLNWVEPRKGSFKISWLYVKDIPNKKLRHIVLDNGKLAIGCRDGEELPRSQGCAMLKSFRDLRMETSLLQDYKHYEAKEAEWARYRASKLD